MLLKKNIIQYMLILQITGYSVLFFLIIGNEVFDFPHTIFGMISTPVNIVEMVTESIFVCITGSITIYFSTRLLKRIKYLEGYLPICAECKKIRSEETWKPIERYITQESEALFTHSLCPECVKKYLID